MTGVLLALDSVCKSFGGIHAVNEASLRVTTGSIHGLIGPNGAGKSTLFHLISGHLQPTSGQIFFDGRQLKGEPPDQRARLGIAIAFQTARVFQDMSVLETVKVGSSTWAQYGLSDALFCTQRYRDTEAQITTEAQDILHRVNLLAYADNAAQTLPLGKQRQLQIARALCARPKLLLLDEPASGLRGEERLALAALIREIRNQGVTVVLVEHDVGFVMTLSDCITVLELGTVIANGAPQDIRRNHRVIQSYLGEEGEES